MTATLPSDVIELDRQAAEVAAELRTLTGDDWRAVEHLEETDPAADLIDYGDGVRCNRTIRHLAILASDQHRALILMNTAPSWSGGTRRFAIHGDFPTDPDTGRVLQLRDEPNDWQQREKERGAITVGRDRGAAAIAREIARRCLPAYLERLAALRELAAARADRTAAAVRAAESIAQRIPGSRVSNDQGEVEVRVSDNGAGYWTLRVSPETIYVERAGSIPLDVALKLAKNLNDAAHSAARRAQ